VVICLERGADWHVAQLMPLPLTVSCFSKIQIGSPKKRAVKRVCVCACVCLSVLIVLIAEYLEVLASERRCNYGRKVGRDLRHGEY